MKELKKTRNYRCFEAIIISLTWILSVGGMSPKNAPDINEDKDDLVVSADPRKSVKETEQTACETARGAKEEEEDEKRRTRRRGAYERGRATSTRIP